MPYLLLILSLSLVGCSSLQKMALRSSSPMFVEGSNKLTLENNWEFFRESAPGNLKFVEMIYLQDTDNLEILSTLVKGYAGYAYAVPETLALKDELEEVEVSEHKQNALMLYTKALDYGLEYFQKKGIPKNKLLSMGEKDLLKLMNKKLTKKDYSAVLSLLSLGRA